MVFLPIWFTKATDLRFRYNLIDTFGDNCHYMGLFMVLRLYKFFPRYPNYGLMEDDEGQELYSDRSFSFSVHSVSSSIRHQNKVIETLFQVRKRYCRQLVASLLDCFGYFLMWTEYECHSTQNLIFYGHKFLFKFIMYSSTIVNNLIKSACFDIQCMWWQIYGELIWWWIYAGGIVGIHVVILAFIWWTYWWIICDIFIFSSVLLQMC